MKTNILVKKIGNNKQNSFWYCGQDIIAEVVYLSRKIIVIIDGTTKICEGGKLITNNKALRKAIEMDLCDNTLERLTIKCSNYFDFIYQNTLTDKSEKLSNDECYTYQDALTYAKKVIKNDKLWIDGTIFPSRVTTVGIPENMLRYQIKGEKFIPPKRTDYF